MRYRILLVPLLIAALASPAGAGIIFGKKPKVVPEKRVPELLGIVKNDGDENKRFEAAEELRQYDAAQFPLMVPTLIEVLMTDKKASVRSEAAQSLAKLRPVSQQVGQALEYARDKDPSLRVRMQARSSLMSYHFAGFWGGEPGQLKPEGQTGPTTKEPPLAAPAVAPPPLNPPPLPTTTPTPRPVPILSTPPAPVIGKPVGTLQPLPKGPPTPVPAPVKEEKGPQLGPQE